MRTQQAAALTILAAVVGCSSPTAIPTNDVGRPNDSLAEAGEIARLVGANAPASGPTPAALAQYEGAYTFGYKAIKEGEVVVVWGAKMAGEGDLGKGADVIAVYEKKAPTEGGRVVMTNGKIKTLTADEFKTMAPPAPKK